MKIIILILSMIFSLSIFAEQVLKAESFLDQFENKLELNEKIEVIIFTKDKSSSEIIHKVFTELKVNNLEQVKVLYIADISGMPGFVSKLFAIPKMRKYEYKIALDRNGEMTKELPHKEEMISLIKINKLNISESIFVNNETDFKKFIEPLWQASVPK